MDKNNKNSKALDFNKLFSNNLVGVLIYALLISFGVFLNAFIQGLIDNGIVMYILSIIVMIFTYAMLYYYGYISSKNKVGIKKYSIPFWIFIIFGVICIIANTLLFFGLDSGIALLFIYLNNLFLNSNALILTCLSNLFQGFTGMIGMLLTIIIMMLGVRRNIINTNKKGV